MDREDRLDPRSRRVVWLGVGIVLAVLLIGVIAWLASPPEVAKSADTTQPSEAVAIPLSTNDLAAIATAYTTWVALPELWGAPPYTSVPCRIEAVPGTFHAAAVKASGVTWAFGRLRPKPGCMVGTGSSRFDPSKAYPFGTGSAASSGVFEKDLNGPWEMNYFESYPFPCPDHSGTPFGNPGPEQPYVPPAVLNALGIHYAAGCANLYVPPAPR